MNFLELLGAVMLLAMLFAIFIGIPISFTLLFLALIFGFIGLGSTVFDLAYLQTIGLMKQDEFVAVPMFILMRNLNGHQHLAAWDKAITCSQQVLDSMRLGPVSNPLKVSTCNNPCGVRSISWPANIGG